MKKETKLEKVKIFLDENGIDYFIPKGYGKVGHSDLVIPRYKIHIKLSTNPSEMMYFIRSTKVVFTLSLFVKKIKKRLF